MVFLYIFVFLLAFIGASIGSFLNVVVWRVPEKMSLVYPPSHCPKCNAKIRWFDNLPIVSWFVLRGKCRDCKEPVSFRYPLVETLSCLAALFVSWALLIGTWSGWKSQPFYWEDYANWAVAVNFLTNDSNVAADSSRDVTSELVKNSEIKDNPAASEEFLRLLKLTTIVAVLWTITIDLALMLGFVEWDRGVSPSSLTSASVIVLLLDWVALLLINDVEYALNRTVLFFTSALLGSLASFLCFRLVGKTKSLEFIVLGAIWGVCSGTILAFPGAFVLSLFALWIRRRYNKQIYGLSVFFSLTILVFLEGTRLLPS